MSENPNEAPRVAASRPLDEHDLRDMQTLMFAELEVYITRGDGGASFTAEAADDIRERTMRTVLQGALVQEREAPDVAERVERAGFVDCPRCKHKAVRAPLDHCWYPGCGWEGRLAGGERGAAPDPPSGLAWALQYAESDIAFCEQLAQRLPDGDLRGGSSSDRAHLRAMADRIRELVLMASRPDTEGSKS